jgi:thioredoxin-like negative regulator of GroEL
MARFGIAILLAFLLVGGGVRADELLVFFLPGCRPCAKFEALLEAHPEVVRDFTVSRVDMSEQTETARLFAVKSAPTIIRLDADDKEVGRLIGAPTKRQLERWLANDPNPLTD